MYIAGGCDGAQTCFGGYCTCTAITDEVLAFDPVTNAYTILPAMPVARYRHDACALGDTIYYFGGRTLPNSYFVDFIIDQVDAFNTTSRSWTTLPPAANYPAGLGSDNSCAVVGNVVYLSGGYNADYTVSYSATYAFAPPAVSGGAWWTLRAGAMLAGRGDFASVAVGGFIHAYGGFVASTTNTNWTCQPLVSHEVYDPVADVWGLAAPLPVGLAEKDDGIVLDGVIYSIGGQRTSVTGDCNDLDIVALPYVFAFDTATTTGWTNVSSLPDGRLRFASAVVGSTIFVFGGQGALVDGNVLPVLTTVYSGQLAPAAPASNPLSYSPGALAGAIVGTCVATLLLVVLAALGVRRCRAKAEQSPPVKVQL